MNVCIQRRNLIKKSLTNDNRTGETHSMLLMWMDSITMSNKREREREELSESEENRPYESLLAHVIHMNMPIPMYIDHQPNYCTRSVQCQSAAGVRYVAQTFQSSFTGKTPMKCKNKNMNNKNNKNKKHQRQQNKSESYFHFFTKANKQIFTVFNGHVS